MKAALILACAVLSGLTAGFATMRLFEDRSRELPRMWTVRSVAGVESGVLVRLSDGRELRIDTVTGEESARSVVLMYPGKTVAVEEADGCTLLVPLLQFDRPALSEERYRALVAAGHRDRDLAVAWTLPAIAGTSLEDVGVGTPAACGDAVRK